MVRSLMTGADFFVLLPWFVDRWIGGMRTFPVLRDNHMSAPDLRHYLPSSSSASFDSPKVSSQAANAL